MKMARIRSLLDMGSVYRKYLLKVLIVEFTTYTGRTPYSFTCYLLSSQPYIKSTEIKKVILPPHLRTRKLNVHRFTDPLIK